MKVPAFFSLFLFSFLYLVSLNHAHSVVIANARGSKKNGGCWLMLGFGCGVRIWTLFLYVLFLVFSKLFFHSWSIMVVVIVSLFLHCFLWDILHVRLYSEVNLKPRWADFNLWWSFFEWLNATEKMKLTLGWKLPVTTKINGMWGDCYVQEKTE